MYFTRQVSVYLTPFLLFLVQVQLLVSSQFIYACCNLYPPEMSKRVLSWDTKIIGLHLVQPPANSRVSDKGQPGWSGL